MNYLIRFMRLKHLDLNINLLPWHLTLICTQNSTLFYTAVYKTCQKCSETNIQHTFFVFSPILVKVYIFWKEIWQKIQIWHWFCCRRYCFLVLPYFWLKMNKIKYNLDHPVSEDCKIFLKFSFCFYFNTTVSLMHKMMLNALLKW